MTLRLRLVLALVVLLTVGLALFGFGTYSLYARSQYDRLDQQISASVPSVSMLLHQSVAFENGTTTTSGNRVDNGGLPPAGGPRPQGGNHGGPPTYVPPSTYAQLRDESGQVIDGGTMQLVSSSGEPDLPSTLKATPSANRYFTTGSATGEGSWRVLVTEDPDDATQTVVIAVPLGEVTSALNEFVLIEIAAAIALLAILSIGSWLILRRGLHPLELMSTTAGEITAGDLSQRVSPSGGPTEVGQLGLALNTMLDDIEEAFHERDVTEQRLRQFLADASHELRTPITSIQGFAELFRVGADHAQVDLPTILRRIEEESARMRLLVEDLLLLAQLDQTRQMETEPVDLAVLAADACSDAVAADRERPVTLNAPEPVVVLGDQAHLRQAVANLVSNAVAHTPPGSPLEVSARLDGDGAIVAVRDHGPGLDAEARAHVFDRFWQADRARSGSGAGLGLAIVAGIAAEHGGSATVADAPGGGAVFTIRLPRPAGPGAGPATPAAEA